VFFDRAENPLLVFAMTRAYIGSISGVRASTPRAHRNL
jgi:hypothetical protein